MTEYAKQSDLDKLVVMVEQLSNDVKESRDDIKELAKESRAEIQKLTIDLTTTTERFAAMIAIIKNIEISIDTLVTANNHRIWIKELLLKSPKFIASCFTIVSLSIVFFSTNAHKDFFKYLSMAVKAKYGLQ